MPRASSGAKIKLPMSSLASVPAEASSVYLSYHGAGSQWSFPTQLTPCPPQTATQRLGRRPGRVLAIHPRGHTSCGGNKWSKISSVTSAPRRVRRPSYGPRTTDRSPCRRARTSVVADADLLAGDFWRFSRRHVATHVRTFSEVAPCGSCCRQFCWGRRGGASSFT